MTGIWLDTNLSLDVLDSVREAARQLERLPDEIVAWKWVTIAMVSAANSALVAHLSGTMQIGALGKRQHQQQLEALNSGHSRTSAPFLANTAELLDRASAGTWDATLAPLLVIAEVERRELDRLVGLRNEFLHFKPTEWSLECSGLPRICRAVLGVVEKVAEAGWAFRHLDPTQRQLLDDAVQRMARGLGRIEAAYRPG